MNSIQVVLYDSSGFLLLSLELKTKTVKVQQNLILVVFAETVKTLRSSFLWACVFLWSQNGLARDTYYETGDPARLPAQLAVRWRQKKWNSVRWGKIYFVLEQPRLNKKYLVPSRQAQSNKESQGPLSYVLFDSPFTSVSTVSRGHPSQVSLGLALVRGEVHFVLLNRFESPHSKLYQKLPWCAIAASYNAEVIMTVFSGASCIYLFQLCYERVFQNFISSLPFNSLLELNYALQHMLLKPCSLSPSEHHWILRENVLLLRHDWWSKIKNLKTLLKF